MSEIDEVLTFARDYVNKPATRTSERKAIIRNVIRKLTGKKLDNGCGTCYIEALFTILNLSKMASTKYELKKGVLLEAFGHPEMTCTALTITDAIGDWYMANFPEKKIYFSKYPVATAPVVPTGITVIPPKKEVKEEISTSIKEEINVLGRNKPRKK